MTTPQEMTVPQLREALKERGLSAAGRKPELAGRLQAALASASAVAQGGGEEAPADQTVTGEKPGESRALIAGSQRALPSFPPWRICTCECDLRLARLTFGGSLNWFEMPICPPVALVLVFFPSPLDSDPSLCSSMTVSKPANPMPAP
jgi:hypothetical protein